MAVVAEAERHIDLVGVEGSSDDLDVPIEACFADENFVAQHGLGTANSVNIVRLIVQAANFVYSYFRGTNNWFVLKIVFDCLQAILTSLFIDHIRPLLHRDSETYLQVGEEPATPSPLQPALFAVPCGAAGNLASGLLAAQLGLPLKFIAATNSNDALHRVLSGNMLRRMDTTRTVSPSMDIQVCVAHSELPVLPPVSAMTIITRRCTAFALGPVQSVENSVSSQRWRCIDCSKMSSVLERR
eukprot:INCI15483.1.p1 GENE.INCI15483.1~~INCI15483.1.p1  ORF type:complete len:242 (-),score=34.19 INCI15483.1:1009-1734(-)